MQELKKIWKILSPAERRKFTWLSLVVFIMALLEVVGVASILPFIQLVADPGIVDRNEQLHNLYVYFHFKSARQMLLYAGTAVILLLCITNGFSVFKTWLQYKSSWNVAHSVSMRMLNSYLGRPYEYFLTRNTSKFLTYIIGETTNLINGVVVPIIDFLSRGLVCLIIFSLLLWVDVEIALVMFGTLGSAYLIIYLFQRKRLRQIGEQRIALSVKRYTSLQELFNGIKTVQVFDRHAFFSERYEAASKDFCDLQPTYNVMVAAPRYILEVLAFGAIVVVTIYLYLTVGDIINIIPRLSLYAVAGYRLLPALQGAFSAVGKLVHNYPVIDKIYSSLYGSKNQASLPLADKSAAKNNDATEAINNQLPFRSAISLDRVSFTYQGNAQPTLQEISLQIGKGEKVAFVGSTGSGKTTLVDLIVGLLRPEAGEIRIDQDQLSPANLPAWRSSIAYVPQDVFLFDDSVVRNISLQEKLNPEEQLRLEEAARLADIHAFITEELAEGYATKVGEKGVRLSGGQRQRIGLARAFFHQPSVLVLDEATSALDNVTERGIIESLSQLPEEITTIMIAHRLSTVRHADRIFLIENGTITNQGSYDQLVRESQVFQDMAKSV